ncbi:MAG: redoxin family protein [Phycisphaeraceae bacterium]|nr:redoxin family protein [Phycisphaeraceae bacterium]MCW5764178.1 redoxin family protein [Phycisphaeraceae bacterium]
MMFMLAATLLGASLAIAQPLDDSRLRREGDQVRRAQLDAAELQPFDAGLLSHLTDWRNGESLKPTDLEDKVVLIVFWNNTEPASVRAVAPTLKRIETTHAGKGLITLAVHTQEHWDGAQQRLDSDLFSTLIAHDVTGAFAAALQADGLPDTYIIDRAGQLRFADLDERDSPGAVRALIAETREAALEASSRREQARQAQAERDRREQERSARRSQTSQEPQTARPDAAQFASATWPKHNVAEKLAGARDLQSQPLPVQLGAEVWLTPKPKTLEGQVQLLDFWATWCGPCIKASPMLESLQKRFADDLAVIAVSGQGENEAKVREYLRGKKPGYHYVHDDKQTVYRAFSPRGIPHVVIISSDGVVRWQGNPHEPTFQSIVTQIVNADPWVAARRKARE